MKFEVENHPFSPKKRPKIGFFLERLASQYYRNIWLGVLESAQKLDLHLFTFIIGQLETPPTPPNNLLELIHPQTFDGVILLKTGEMEMLPPVRMPVWSSQLTAVPTVRIGLPFAYGPSIIVDNITGSRQLLEHLITVHHCRHIAFMAGLMDHPDAVMRYDTYRQVLQENNLPFVPEMMVIGNFSRPSGRRAMQQLLDTFPGKLDAVFAANDEMALGAMDLLAEHGIDVPDQIKVIGFDDIQESAFAHSPLTTVRQPLVEMGQVAVEMVYALLQGQPCPSSVELPAQGIIRQSCGCLPQAVYQAGINTAVPPDPQILLKFSPDILDNLGDGFRADLQSSQSNRFLPCLNNILRHQTTSEPDSHYWQNVITLLRSKWQPLSTDEVLMQRAENLWQQARILAADATYRQQAAFRATLEHQTIELSGIIQHISASFDLERLQHTLVTHLPRVGIRKCMLAVFDSETQSASRQLPHESTLLLHFDKDNAISNFHDNLQLATHTLFSDPFMSQSKPEVIIVQSLYQNQRQLGLLLFFVDPAWGKIYQYELLQSEISNVLLGALLVREIQNHAADLGSEVARRTENLLRVNEQLRQYAVELEHSNRELEVVAYVSSHDLQEPLRKIQVFADRLAAGSSGQLDAKGQDYLVRMQTAASRMQSLIHDLLMFSRVTTRQLVVERVDLTQVVQSVLHHFAPEIKQTEAMIVVDDLPIIEADKGQMRLLFENLVDNALKFRQTAQPPVVQIRAERGNGRPPTILITIQDNGIGIEEKYQGRIFNAFQRLHGRDQYEGSGIGLAVCRRIVERHQGSITVLSKYEEGSTFSITLPLKYLGDKTDTS